MKADLINALAELARSAAKAHGWNEETPIEFTVCRPKTNCTICLNVYAIESESDPCPFCGAGYIAQIYGEFLEDESLVIAYDLADPTGSITVYCVTDGKTFRPIKK